MNAVCTLDRSYYRNGLLGLALFVPFTLFAVVLPFWNPDGSFPPGRQVLAAVCFLAVLGVPNGVALLSVLAYKRERLEVAGDAVRFRGVFRRRSVSLPEVTRAHWRPGVPSLKLYGPGGPLTVWFGNYKHHHRKGLLEHFRARLPAAVQEG